MALVAADTPISQVAGAGVVNSALAGSDAVLIVGGVTSLNYYLMAQSQLKTPEQLKGGSMAISRFGSASDFIARFALSKIGLTPGQRRYPGPNRQYFRAYGCYFGRTSAGHGHQPAGEFYRREARHDGIGGSSQLGLVYQHTSAATTKKYIRENPDLVRRYVKSQVEAVHRIYTDKETSIKVLSKYFGRGVEREIL